MNVTTSTTAVAFLDLTVYKHENKIAFRTFQKELNVYQYLPRQSQHNPACIRGYISRAKPSDTRERTRSSPTASP